MTQMEVDELEQRARYGQLEAIGEEPPPPPDIVFSVNRPTIILSRWELADAVNQEQRRVADRLDDELRALLASRFGAAVLTEAEIGTARLPDKPAHPVYRLDLRIDGYDRRKQPASAADNSVFEVHDLRVVLTFRQLQAPDARPIQITYEAKGSYLDGRFKLGDLLAQVTNQVEQDPKVQALFPRRFE